MTSKMLLLRIRHFNFHYCFRPLFAFAQELKHTKSIKESFNVLKFSCWLACAFTSLLLKMWTATIHAIQQIAFHFFRGGGLNKSRLTWWWWQSEKKRSNNRYVHIKGHVSMRDCTCRRENEREMLEGWKEKEEKPWIWFSTEVITNG